MNAPLCIVVKGFPRISETFITRELEALQDAGMAFSLASLRRPAADASAIEHRVAAQPNYLPEYLHAEPGRVWRSVQRARTLPGFGRALRMFRRDVVRDFSRNRFRRFGQACVLAAELPADVRHLHAHFIHTPASVARYAAAIRDMSFSVSAHAKDIWTSPDWDLADKLREADFVCVCNGAGFDRLAALAEDHPPKFWPHLIQPMAHTPRERDRRIQKVRFLTVARAVPKKGLKSLLQAFARLGPDKDWSWTYIGGGTMLDEIRSIAREHPFRDRLSILGARSHGEVLEALHRHDVFVLAAEVAEDGDRDGRPNALIEAMDAGLACVATPVGGIPELLSGGAGVLVQPGPDAIAEALREIVKRPEQIEPLAAAAQNRAAALASDGTRAFAELERALRKASGQ